MIYCLEGEILKKTDGFIVLKSGGIGYKVFVPNLLWEEISEGDKSFLWTHHAVRENSQDLYGFSSFENLEFFELLITVSGIGPKTALNILNIVSVETLRQAVRTENVAHLVKVSGIGRKTAEKIMLELKDKLGKEEAGEGSLRDESDAIEALTSLGYSQREAREALKNISKDIEGTSEKVKHALKFLSK